MWERLQQMMIKEFIQVFRDPKLRAVVLVMPLVQTLIFGYAVTTDVAHVKTAVFDQDYTPTSRALVDRFIRSGYFTAAAYVDSDGELDELFNRGQVSAALRVPPSFAARVAAGESAPVQVIVDGTDANTAGVVLSYARQIVGDAAVEVLQRRAGGPAAPLPQVELASRAWFNADLASRNFYVPGVIAMIVTLVTLLLTSMAVVREKELGTMEQIIVTPILPVEFILGKTMPSVVIGFVNMVFVTLLGVFWFAVPIRGSVGLLFLSTIVYLVAAIGIGLFISTVSATQQQAMMSTFFFFFPAVLLSGFMFPIANMPVAVQYVTLLDPMRYFLIIVRGIFLKGVGLTVLWPQLAALLALGAAVLFLAVRRFRKTLA